MKEAYKKNPACIQDPNLLIKEAASIHNSVQHIQGLLDEKKNVSRSPVKNDPERSLNMIGGSPDSSSGFPAAVMEGAEEDEGIDKDVELRAEKNTLLAKANKKTSETTSFAHCESCSQSEITATIRSAPSLFFVATLGKSHRGLLLDLGGISEGAERPWFRGPSVSMAKSYFDAVFAAFLNLLGEEDF